MELETKYKLLQMFYAGVLADATLRMSNGGILEEVTSIKRNENLLSGKARVQQLQIQSVDAVFTTLSDIFGCANWKVEKTEAGFSAETSSCMLCAMAKKIGAPSPCNIYCLDAMEGMVKGIAPNSEYKVESTMWNSSKCRVDVSENQL